jgi:hypothetical protein
MKTTRALKKDGTPRLLMTKAARRDRRFYYTRWKPEAKRLAKALGLKSIWGEKGSGISLKACRAQLTALQAERKAAAKTN